MGNGLINRMIRALRLDATLYREVAAPGASTEEAALIVVLAAVGFSFAGSAVSLVSWLNGHWSGIAPSEANSWIVMAIQNGNVSVSILALIAAWLAWTGGVWLFSKRLIATGHQAPDYGQIARALAFAQAPGIVGSMPLILTTVVLALVLPRIPAISPQDPAPLAGLELLVTNVWLLLMAWVFLGTLLALREGLGFSYGQALGALLVVAGGLAVLLGLVVTVGSVAAAAVGLLPEAFGSDPPLPIGLTHVEGIATQVASQVPFRIASEFDFNLGLHIAPALMSGLSEPLATVR